MAKTIGGLSHCQQRNLILNKGVEETAGSLARQATYRVRRNNAVFKVLLNPYRLAPSLWFLGKLYISFQVVESPNPSRFARLWYREAWMLYDYPGFG